MDSTPVLQEWAEALARENLELEGLTLNEDSDRPVWVTVESGRLIVNAEVEAGWSKGYELVIGPSLFERALNRDGCFRHVGEQ